MFLRLILLFTLAYLVGSIPFSYLIAKWVGKVDLKKVGSKNPGGSNAVMSVGAAWGVFGGLLDVLKGSILVVGGAYFSFGFSEMVVLVCGVIIGHCWSAFLGGKGGRGVATMIGTLLLLYPKGVLIALSPSIVFLILNAKGIFKVGNLIPRKPNPTLRDERNKPGFIFDSALGTVVGCVLFIILSACSGNWQASMLGLLAALIIAVRRVTEDVSEYKGPERFNRFLLRLLYDRNVYDLRPQRLSREEKRKT